MADSTRSAGSNGFPMQTPRHREARTPSRRRTQRSRSFADRSRRAQSPSTRGSTTKGRNTPVTTSGVIVASKEISSKDLSKDAAQSTANSTHERRSSVGETLRSKSLKDIDSNFTKQSFDRRHQPARRANSSWREASSRSSSSRIDSTHPLRTLTNGSLGGQNTSEERQQSNVINSHPSHPDFLNTVDEGYDSDPHTTAAFQDMPQTVALHTAQNKFPKSCEMYTALWLTGFMPVTQGGDKFFGPQITWNATIQDVKIFHRALERTGGDHSYEERQAMIARIAKTMKMLRPPYARALIYLAVAFVSIFIGMICLIGYFADGNQPDGWLIPGLIFISIGAVSLILAIFLPNRFIRRNRKRDKQVEVNFQQFNTFFKLRDNTFVYRSVEEELEPTFGLKVLRFLGMRERVRCLILLHPGEPRPDFHHGGVHRQNTKNWGEVTIPDRLDVAIDQGIEDNTNVNSNLFGTNIADTDHNHLVGYNSKQGGVGLSDMQKLARAQSVHSMGARSILEDIDFSDEDFSDSDIDDGFVDQRN